MAVVTSLPGPSRGTEALERVLEVSTMVVKEILSKMNINNKRGKELWALANLGPDTRLIVVPTNLEKKQQLEEIFGVESVKFSRLVDDYDKNTKIFGKDGWLIPSAGNIRLQNFL
eukprot:TRINITY_DN1889_c0_g1_i5.p1 TRINITY_DN1889_c0_g1~~TRINITY_DN1889_c0_g1_i5.p1  ORF type:complete len:115 (-),score=37.28 TRINITY_DN1889_c0_g1_i5:173-517(-)